MNSSPGDDIDPERPDTPTGAVGSGDIRATPGAISDSDDLDYDAAFAALIAQFDDQPFSSSASSTSLGVRAPDTERPWSTAATPIPLNDPVPPPPPAEPWYPAVLDEHYEPVDPGPLPRGDLVSRAAWLGVLGGPALLILIGVLRGSAPGWMILLAALGFIGGFITLVLRMPAERDEDDDGAVV